VRQRGHGRWAVELKDTVTGQRRWLGTFACPEEGALAFDRAAREIRGEGTEANFPPGAYLASTDPPVVMSAKGVVLFAGSPERRASRPAIGGTGPSTAVDRDGGTAQVPCTGPNRFRTPGPGGTEAAEASEPRSQVAAQEFKGWGTAEMPASSGVGGTENARVWKAA